MVKCARTIVYTKGDYERVKRICAKNKRIKRLISGYRLDDASWLITANFNSEDDTEIDIQESK